MNAPDKCPWHQRVRRWAQTNLTENDPPIYDPALWRKRWRDSRIGGIIVNAGGIVAYFPSKFSYHYRAQHLGDRDLLGEIVAAARAEGLAVLARMDSNRALPDFYEAHPDWFCRTMEGQPFEHAGRYAACVNSPYYKEYIPDLLREIYAHCEPDGFTDNSWTGVGRDSICHCANCRKQFREEAGDNLPQSVDWDSPLYRRWIRWSYDCRLANWDLNNQTTKAFGGKNCLWLGMVHSEPVTGHVHFADLSKIGPRTPILMTDQQSRTTVGFEQNAHAGKLLHEVSTWCANIPESMALYLRGPQGFRLAANPPAEARHWMRSGMAAGISPWWHIVGAGLDDRRRLDAADELLAWHEANEDALYERSPIASIGLLWSNENSDFYGRDDADRRVLAPYRGWLHALTHARLPWLPVHANHIRKQAGRLEALIVPDVRALSDGQMSDLQDYAQKGGSLIFSGQPGTLDEMGDPRTTSPLEELLGVALTGRQEGLHAAEAEGGMDHPSHSYIRLHQGTDGRHYAAFAGLENTDILAFGGTIDVVRPHKGTTVLATLVPGFESYPPEFAWMRTPQTDIPAITVRSTPSSGRIIYLAADIDRCHELRRLPDHAVLLGNLATWAIRSERPFMVSGKGYFDCHLYRQGSRLIFHLVNLTGCNLWPGYLETVPAVGPLVITIPISADRSVASVESRVSKTGLSWKRGDTGLVITLQSLVEHELLVID